jgi:hypothetical protein
MHQLIKAYLYFKDKIDYLLGGSVGLTVGAIKTELYKYFDHFLTEDSLFKLLDACLTTIATTILGAVLLHVLHKYVFKKGEEK